MKNQLTALVAALAIVPLTASARDDNDSARWLAPLYRDNAQVTIPCSASTPSSGVVCTVSFARSEILGDFFVGDPAHWKIQPAYSGNRLPTGATPQLVAQVMQPGLRTNVVIYARNTPRVYRLLFVSVKDVRPLYASFAYPKPPAPVRHIVAVPRPIATLAPTLSQIVDSACVAQTDGYTADTATNRRGQIDPVVAAIRPHRICRDRNHTYVQLEEQVSTADVDVPIAYEEEAGGNLTQVDYKYFERERIFVVNTVANIVLRTTVGKRVVDMHIRRAQPALAAGRG